MHRANSMRVILGPVRLSPQRAIATGPLGLPMPLGDNGPPDDAASNPRNIVLAQLRARLLRMILENERVRRHEKQASPQ